MWNEIGPHARTSPMLWIPIPTVTLLYQGVNLLVHPQVRTRGMSVVVMHELGGTGPVG